MKLNRNGSNGKAKALFAHAIAAALVAALAGPVVAWGVTELEYDPAGTGAGLTDNPTHVEVYKLEKGNTNFVEGAKMRITRKDTGEVVASWTTGKTAYALEGKLDTGVVYVLEEVEAPKGYEKAPKTEFKIESEEHNTHGEILNKHDDVTGSDVTGTTAEQAFVINLYDKATVTVQKEEHKQTTKKLAQTSDTINMPLIIGLGGAGAAALVVGVIARSRKRDE